MANPAERPIVLVTGSSGFIGTAVVEHLNRSHRVVGFDHVPTPKASEAEDVRVDLTSDASVREGLQHLRSSYGNKLAAVIHLVAYYSFSGEPSDKYQTVTVEGTRRLLAGLRDFEVGQFLFSSSMLVEAPCQPGQKINEESPLDPKWAYPQSKVETENLIRRERGRIPATLMRIAGVYNDACHSIPLSHQIQRIYERQLTSKVFPGDLSHGQDYVHVDDVAAAMEAAVARSGRLPQEFTVLVGEPETLSYGETQKILGRLIHDENWDTLEIPKSLAKTGAWMQEHMPLTHPFIKPWMIDLADDHYALDITRAATQLGWHPAHSLGATFPEMIRLLKQDPKAFYKENKLEWGHLAEAASRRERRESAGPGEARP